MPTNDHGDDGVMNDGVRPGAVPAAQAGSERLSPSEVAQHANWIDKLPGRWWVLHTRARNEKVIAGCLDRMHIQYFLPLVPCQRMYGKRVRTVRIPIFPGYIFLCGTNEDRLAALRTNRVANVLEVPDQDQLRWDLRQICRVVESNEPCALYPGLQRGSRCRVISGSLAGLEGVVLRRRGLSRVYVAVEMIGQSAELEIDAMRLELIG